MRAVAATAAIMLLTISHSQAATPADFARLPGGSFRSTLPVATGQYTVQVPPFLLQRRPVTNEQFLSFVRGHKEWARGSVPRIFADEAYLSHWDSPDQLVDAAQKDQPVTRVSWFAAEAYCESQKARLPTWYEWEMAAAASGKEPDARANPEWRQQILNWYAVPAGAPLRAVGQMPATVHGVQDLHGLIWEWVEDAGSLMVSGDNRDQGDPDLAKFCGTGALTLEQKENYAVLMRIAMLSSLRAADTTRSMGFRCARSDFPEQ